MNYLLEILGKGLEMSPAELMAEHLTLPRLKAAGEPINRGLDLLRAGKPEAATRCLAPFCNSGPYRAAAHIASAVACDEESNTRRAVNHLLAAMEILPGRTDILAGLGLCCEKAHLSREAIKFYRRAINRDPAGSPARYRLAAIQITNGNCDEAIKQCRALSHFELRHNWLIGAIGALNYRNGKYDRAVQLLQAAIAMEPENWALADEDIEELVNEGKFYHALERLHELLQRQGPFADLHVRIADLYGRTGDDEQAIRHYLRALDIQPDYLEGTVKLGSHHLAFGRIEQAAEAFHRAAELNNRITFNYVALGCAHLSAGRKSDAHNAFELAVAVEPNTVTLMSETLRLHSLLAETDMHDAVNTKEIIRQTYDNDRMLIRQVSSHARELAANDRADLRYTHGMLLLALGQVDGAQKQFTRAVEINPAHMQSIVELGIIRHKKGLKEKAEETFRQAADISQDLLRRHYHLALLHSDPRKFARVTHVLSARQENQWIKKRSVITTSLEQMGLLDTVSSTWRNLQSIHCKDRQKR